MANRVVIVPGNACADVEKTTCWYAWARDEINKIDGVECIVKTMPDSELARESFWIPFMKDDLCCDKNTIIIGHSSGAVAAMRFAEKYEVRGIILVSVCVTDLGMESERVSGYYSRSWEWSQMKANTGFFVQFGSTDDPFIPWTEMQEVADNLHPDLQKYSDREHFCTGTFPELIDSVKKYLKD